MGVQTAAMCPAEGSITQARRGARREGAQGVGIRELGTNKRGRTIKTICTQSERNGLTEFATKSIALHVAGEWRPGPGQATCFPAAHSSIIMRRFGINMTDPAGPGPDGRGQVPTGAHFSCTPCPAICSKDLLFDTMNRI